MIGIKRAVPGFLLFLSLAVQAQQGAGPGRNLVWSDEFNYKGLPDSAKWGYDAGGYGWGNHELQFYTIRRAENARVEDGKLIIEARKEPWEGKEYTSARLVTRGKGDWKYGRIEVRARLPKGVGTWPAIWMLGSVAGFRWPEDGEIDIMEHVGWQQGYIHGSIHCKKYNHILHTQKMNTVQVSDCSEKFHVYGLEWNADSIRISVDDAVYFSFANERKAVREDTNRGDSALRQAQGDTNRGNSDYSTWPFDNKMHLLLNVAVGGDWGGVKGVDGNIWPQRMEIDYVRVYQ